MVKHSLNKRDILIPIYFIFIKYKHRLLNVWVVVFPIYPFTSVIPCNKIIQFTVFVIRRNYHPVSHFFILRPIWNIADVIIFNKILPYVTFFEIFNGILCIFVVFVNFSIIFRQRHSIFNLKIPKIITKVKLIQ